MSASTIITSGGLVTFTIKVDGKAIPSYYQIQSVCVDQCLNRISSAEVVLCDGSASKQNFAISGADTFIPGKKITIDVGYDMADKPIFSGLISKQSLRVTGDSASVLVVECKDQALKMTVGRHNAKFTNMTDNAVIKKIIGNYSALSADVANTRITQAELVQYYCSDWDFVLCRAEINGLFVSNHGGKITVLDPTKKTNPVLTIAYGNNLVSFDGDLNAVNQLAKIKASAWDPNTQKIINTQVNNSDSGPGNLSSKKLSEVIGLSEFELQTAAPQDKPALDGWAQAQMLKSRFGKVTADVTFKGTEKVNVGQFITLAGLGDRFNGDHLVSKVSHEIRDGIWLVTAQLGLSPQWFVQQPDVMAPTAAGLLPGIAGLQMGKVKKIHEDPEAGLRILVDFPLLDPQQQGVWARLSHFYATKGQGAFFLPEIADEVVVGFLNDDPRYPVILGSLYSKGIKP